MLQLFRFLPVLLVCLISQTAGAANNKPNLIVILTDDQGYADVGFNGSTDIKTPNIDRIAGEGVRFTNGYVTYPVCGPSRAGLLTGRYQDRFGFSRNPTIDPTNPSAGIPLNEKNMAEVLKPVGYRTGVIGKWHMGTHPTLHPNQRGFDYFFGFLSGGHQYFPEQLTLNDISESRKAYDWYRTRILRNQERIDIDEYLTDEFSNEAVEFIEREKDHPFLLYLAFNAPHGPLQATDEYLARHENIKDPKRRTYAAMISAVDDGVGRVLETLQKHDLDKNTIIFFLSDNGGAKNNASSNAPLRGHKSTPFEGGVRVPFAMRWPVSIPAGVDYEYPVSSMDILATIVASSQAPVSEDKPLDGVDLLPYLTGTKRGRPHETLFWKNHDKGWFASRVGDDKLIYNYDSSHLVFDLEKDGSEKKNLIKKRKLFVRNAIEDINEWNAQTIDPVFPGLGSWHGQK